MADQDNPLLAVSAFSRLLERLELPYLIGGSFASSVHGEFRTTNDIDFLVKIGEGNLDRFFSHMKPDFVFDEVAIRNAVQERRSFNVIHESTFMKIDVFTHIAEFQGTELARAQSIPLPDSTERVRVATAEDIVLAKLAWFKSGNKVSERQWRDVIGVLKVQGSRLDHVYLRSQAQELGILELLSKALTETGSRGDSY